MHSEIDHLIQAVQRNCDISDARHAGDYTMCIYLLHMREYYRWRQGVELGEKLSHRDVGAWVEKTEQYWDEIEDHPFQPIPVLGETIDPFEQAQVNRLLAPQGYIYGAGYGRMGKPIFFLSRLVNQENTEHYSLYIAGEELAREMSAPPAMMRDRTIMVRRESLRRLIWEMIDEWRWHKRQNAMARMLDFYDYEADGANALECITDHELETLIMHEIGEIVSGEMLGEQWEEMLYSIRQPAIEAILRAIRDNLADCVSTLPSILSSENHRSLHFYFAGLTPLRKQLFPALENAYQQWNDNGDFRVLSKTVRKGKIHWLDVAHDLLKAMYPANRSHNPEALIQTHRL